MNRSQARDIALMHMIERSRESYSPPINNLGLRSSKPSMKNSSERLFRRAPYNSRRTCSRGGCSIRFRNSNMTMLVQSSMDGHRNE